MFSPAIVESDAFLEMPISTQALYFHLGMFADDDGFVNPKKIMRMIGVSDDDLKILVGKRFVLAFDNGVVVVKHWKINNLVRKDWYRPTQYLEQKNALITKDNGAYTEIKHLVNESLPEDRIDQVRSGEEEIPLEIKKLEFLEKIPKEIVDEFKIKFKCEEGEIRTKGHALADYCRAKGKKYKNYKAFLSNALRRDYGERPPKQKVAYYDTSSGRAVLVGYKTSEEIKALKEANPKIL